MRVPLTVVAAVLYVLGWTVGKLWVVLSWLATAVRVGFTEAIGTGAPEPPAEPAKVHDYPAPADGSARRGLAA